MPQWDAEQYLRYGEQRSQVSRDLARRVAEQLPDARRIVDLGCGPGNSTEVLHAVWPRTERLLGLDASATMLASARRDYPQYEFAEADIPTWAASGGGGERWDLVFSNSALQWVPGHDGLMPRLLAKAAHGGALAIQMPTGGAYGTGQIAAEMAAMPKWLALMQHSPRDWHSHPLDFYYDLLAPLAAGLELWETDYIEPMAGAEAIIDWYKGSGLRPFLEALPGEAERAEFLREYTEGVRQAYPAQPDGVILFRMRRRFLIAWAR